MSRPSIKVKVNYHSVSFYDAVRTDASSPNVSEYRLAILSAPHRAVTAEDLAADPEFQQWAAEERAAEIAVLTARARR